MVSTQSLRLFGITLLFCFATCDAAYTLVESYDSTSFLEGFSFFTAADPTEGFVDFVSAASAQSSDLITTSNNQVYLGVDHTTYNPAGGRQSTRLTSNTAFGQGLFIADISHIPTGCGVWPAFWMFGPNWPASGEIDIIEGVNNQATNTISLHTNSGCTTSNLNSLAGTVTTSTDCGSSGTGCSVTAGSPVTYGAGFNAAGGGTYAMQWASTGIYVWFWQRGQVPADVLNEVPNTGSWGTPLATFSGGGCDFLDTFKQQNLVFDTTFCGDWAGANWGSSTCAAMAPTCEQYVALNPGAFLDAYWTIESVKVYDQ